MSSSEIKIIKLNPQEWLRYKEIRLESLRMEPQAFNSIYSEVIKKPDQYWIDELSNPNKTYLFAEADGNIVGTMNVSFNENNIKSDAVVHGVYVNISSRRKGIGRLLLSALLEEAKQHLEITKVTLMVMGSQIKARKLYESLGFAVTGKNADNELIMEKSLI